MDVTAASEYVRDLFDKFVVRHAAVDKSVQLVDIVEVNRRVVVVLGMPVRMSR